MKEGYVVLKQNRGLFALLWIGVIYMFFYMPISTLFLSSVCHTSKEHRPMPLPLKLLLRLVCCLAESFWAFGAVLRNGGTPSVFPFSWWALAICSPGFCRQTHFLSLLCAVLLWEFPLHFTVCKMRFSRNGQTRISGESFSLLTSAASLAMPFGLVISGPLAERLGVEKWFVICGIGIIIVALAVFLLPGLREIDNTQ